MVQIAEVSLSGYYKHRKLLIEWTTKEQREQKDYETIRNIVRKHHRKYGYRRVVMHLTQKGIIMNHKKVLRIMKKYNMLATIRRKNPYRTIQRKTQEHHTCKNILKRDFTWNKPLIKMGTDVSYIYYDNGQRAYVSIIKDMITGEVLSHRVSSNLWMWFVLETIQQLYDNALYQPLLSWSLLHSDQWFHYTHPSYQKLLQDKNIIQSMSRKWNCLDNAPTESFFWHMKDELELKSIKTYKELEKRIANYMYYYNNERPQRERKKMTPVEYRNHLLAQ